MKLRALALLLVLLAAGCTPSGTGWSAEDGAAALGPDEEAAATNVRAAVPALEAYYADNGSYAGVSLEILRSYDAGITGVEVSGTVADYCLSSTVGSASYSKAGPSGDVQAGGC